VAGCDPGGLRADTAALEKAVSLLLTWVEAEVRGFPDLVEEIMRLRGHVMAVGAAMVGEL
jgi:hypothetical protein